jgi:hypothetical protein
VFALFLLALARGWARAADWPRTPTLLWNALLVPVAWSLVESDRALLAAGVGVLALASIVATLAAPVRRPVEGPGGSENRPDGRGETSAGR